MKLEAIPRSIRKIRLNSEKNIAKAAKELNEALELPDRLAASLQAFAALGKAAGEVTTLIQSMKGTTRRYSLRSTRS